PDSQVSFFVRQVPGGVFSTHVHKQVAVGERVTVTGPLGSFWLRPADAPLLLVAGGSGLAPVLALLEGARERSVARPVTLLFGARSQRDLYALDAIRALAADWPAAFDFIPVLSDEPTGSDWSGARGFVTEVMAERMPPECHAYLCGPPPMIDAATALLLERGVAREHIHADRFTTQHDLQATA
ncbi:MAG: FAD-binding oxidoreductase, partial [Perlucidibaca sp.]